MKNWNPVTQQVGQIGRGSRAPIFALSSDGRRTLAAGKEGSIEITMKSDPAVIQTGATR